MADSSLPRDPDPTIRWVVQVGIVGFSSNEISWVAQQTTWLGPMAAQRIPANEWGTDNHGTSGGTTYHAFASEAEANQFFAESRQRDSDIPL
jgi:hypothetical protein